MRSALAEYGGLSAGLFSPPLPLTPPPRYEARPRLKRQLQASHSPGGKRKALCVSLWRSQFGTAFLMLTYFRSVLTTIPGTMASRN